MDRAGVKQRKSYYMLKYLYILAKCYSRKVALVQLWIAFISMICFCNQLFEIELIRILFRKTCAIKVFHMNAGETADTNVFFQVKSTFSFLSAIVIELYVIIKSRFSPPTHSALPLHLLVFYIRHTVDMSYISVFIAIIVIRLHQFSIVQMSPNNGFIYYETKNKCRLCKLSWFF